MKLSNVTLPCIKFFYGRQRRQIEREKGKLERLCSPDETTKKHGEESLFLQPLEGFTTCFGAIFRISVCHVAKLYAG